MPLSHRVLSFLRSLSPMSSVHPPSPPRLVWLVAVFLAATPLAPTISAQQPAPLTLDSLIAKLQSNLDEYDRSIPSFLADEHIDSTIFQFTSRGSSGGNYETIADSVFRLKRAPDPATHTVMLEESREIKVIDGKPANGHDIDAPSMISGAFSGGLAMVSRDEQSCMRYSVDPVKPRRPIVVRFVSAPADQRPKDCILTEDGSGRVTIDPASMQVTRIEITVPHHVLAPHFSNGQPGPRVVARWRVQVNYRPVALDARTFWLPAIITSTCSTDQVEWSFRATYRNYHKLEVHSRVVLPDDTQ